ncbi:MAG: hypothetical protein Q8P68_00425 [Candidatus Peregrinibacteria bacterium]|nr:hypothetical protein [Candidatus Peregrinibacteria bacterium]MDZ4245169.1 hypothetical protein [Candidatus Gracilibacteria bacterium]
MLSKSEREDRIGDVEDVAAGLYGSEKFVGVFRGTGWGGLLSNSLPIEGTRLDYWPLVPGVELGQGGPDGHTEKRAEVREVDGVEYLDLSKVHGYEGGQEASDIIITGLRKNLRGVILSCGAGSLAGPLPLDEDIEKTLSRSEADIMRKMINEAIERDALVARGGRPLTHMQVGQIGIIREIAPEMVQTAMHRYASGFTGPYYAWLHSHDDRYFAFLRKTLMEVQGSAPEVIYADTFGPTWEPPRLQRVLARNGVDMVGMSQARDARACAENNIPGGAIALTTNGVGVHSHEANQAVGRSKEDVLLEFAKNAIRNFPRD